MLFIKIIWKIEEVYDISWIVIRFIMFRVYMLVMVRCICLFVKVVIMLIWGKFFNVYVVYVNFINWFLLKFRIIDRLNWFKIN